VILRRSLKRENGNMMMIRQLLNFSRRLGGEITVGKKLRKEKVVPEKSGDGISFLLNEMFSFGNDMGLCTKEAAKKKGLKMIGDSKRAELMVNLSRNKPKTIKSLIYDIEGSSTIVFLWNKYHYHSPNLESFNHM
jgi:hypothetical protein